MERRDIYTLVSKNRLRLLALFAAFTLLVMTLSGTGVYLLNRHLLNGADFWIVLLLFWLLCFLFALVRFALGGRWIFRKVPITPPARIDCRLYDALQAARLGAGMDDRVRLLEIPSRDINSFSLALPDKSYAVFLTRGVAEKLPAREREAVAAHELAHISSGDTTLQSALLRMVGPGRSLARGSRRLPALPRSGLPPLLLFVFAALVFAAALRPYTDSGSTLLYALALIVLFAAL